MILAGLPLATVLVLDAFEAALFVVTKRRVATTIGMRFTSDAVEFIGVADGRVGGAIGITDALDALHIDTVRLGRAAVARRRAVPAFSLHRITDGLIGRTVFVGATLDAEEAGMADRVLVGAIGIAGATEAPPRLGVALGKIVVFAVVIRITGGHTFEFLGVAKWLDGGTVAIRATLTTLTVASITKGLCRPAVAMGATLDAFQQVVAADGLVGRAGACSLTGTGRHPRAGRASLT
jgi:hypothetical protein